MRKILFRGKTNTNVWVYGSLIQFGDEQPKIKFVKRTYPDNGRVLETDWCYVKSNTVGQYTGLKDKNGNKIFKGDIVVRRDLTFSTEKTCVVVYNSEIASFRLHYQNRVYTERYPFVSSDTYNDGKCTIDCKYEYEVIGNVVDNPELLKGGEE